MFQAKQSSFQAKVNISANTLHLQNVFRRFPQGKGSSNPLRMAWESFSLCICNLHVQHCSTQNMKQPGIHKIKDGLHEMGVMGKTGWSGVRWLVYIPWKDSIKTFPERFHLTFLNVSVLAGISPSVFKYHHCDPWWIVRLKQVGRYPGFSIWVCLVQIGHPLYLIYCG